MINLLLRNVFLHVTIDHRLTSAERLAATVALALSSISPLLFHSSTANTSCINRPCPQHILSPPFLPFRTSWRLYQTTSLWTPSVTMFSHRPTRLQSTLLLLSSSTLSMILSVSCLTNSRSICIIILINSIIRTRLSSVHMCVKRSARHVKFPPALLPVRRVALRVSLTSCISLVSPRQPQQKFCPVQPSIWLWSPRTLSAAPQSIRRFRSPHILRLRHSHGSLAQRRRPNQQLHHSPST